MSWAAGGVKDNSIKKVKYRVTDCDSDSLDFDDLVIGFGGEACEVNGVVD